MSDVKKNLKITGKVEIREMMIWSLLQKNEYKTRKPPITNLISYELHTLS